MVTRIQLHASVGTLLTGGYSLPDGSFPAETFKANKIISMMAEEKVIDKFKVLDPLNGALPSLLTEERLHP